MARKKPLNFCLNCGKQIYRVSIRCKSCAVKENFRNPEFRRKQSEGLKKHWTQRILTPEWRKQQSYKIKLAWERGVYDSEKTHERRSRRTRAAHVRGVFSDPEILKKKSRSMKAAWERGAYDAPETRRRKSASMYMRWERGDFDEVFTPEVIQRRTEGIRAAYARGIYRAPTSPTSIEIKIANGLDDMEIEHTGQYKPEGYTRIYDEFVLPNVLIEIQGDFFHSEKFFPGITRRDAEKAQWAKEHGFILVAIWEYEIKELGAEKLIRERIMPLL